MNLMLVSFFPLSEIMIFETCDMLGAMAVYIRIARL